MSGWKGICSVTDQALEFAPIEAERSMDRKRPPDPMRPGEIPDTPPGDTVAGPATAVLVATVIAAVAITLIVWAVLS
jgi:hypothetical protein